MCKKALKSVLSFFLILSMIFSFSIFASAFYEYEDNINTEVTSEEAEETGWIYRTNGIVLEKRLWSYTYAKWLTEWEPAY